MSTFSIFAPAKLNLFLAITGRRADGFHDLVSVVTPLTWGDTLRVETRAAGEGAEAGDGFTLACDDPAVPLDGSNLVLKAARAFREATGWRGGAAFFLEKRIPMGAGLGGGSSDATATLKALNELAGRPLGAAEMVTVAAGLGSDCPLFLHGGPVVMRGRGERVEALPERAAARLRGRRVLVFKPDFGIATPWAFGRLAAEAPGSYLASEKAEARLAKWLGEADTKMGAVEALLFNNMEGVAFGKFVALPTLVETLRKRFGLVARMSGSGSACFALLDEGAPVADIAAAIREAWGASALVMETSLA